MSPWTKALVIAAALASGCTGNISDSGKAPGTGQGSGGVNGGSNAGTGASPAGAGTGGSMPGSSACTSGVPGTTRLPLLTNTQYDNTVQELFSLPLTADTVPSTMLAPDGTGSVDQRTWTGFQGAADMLVSKV